MKKAPPYLAAANGRQLTLALLLLVLLLLAPLVVYAQDGDGPDGDGPDVTPDAAPGLDLFAERCANCHGPLGQGDGPEAAQLPQPPANFTDRAYNRTLTPAYIFETITNGIVASGMPPFGPGNSNPISENDRWHLVAAVFSLGISQGELETGQDLYEASCASCHGASGDATTPDLGSQDYWLMRSDEAVAADLQDGDIGEHAELALDGDERLAVVAYARSFSYAYSDPMAAFAPIESAIISGTVSNVTTGAEIAAGTPAVLNAFNADFEQVLAMTTTVGSEGAFAFDLEMAAPDLVYVVSVEYDGLSYASDFARLERANPALTLPVEVFEKSTDSSTVSVEQLHVIVEFGEDSVDVSELYQFTQEAPAVYVGETGDEDAGTVRLALPSDAASPIFQRSFAGVESFFPAENLVQTDDGWADTVPLRPGRGTLSLLTRYTLPYESGMEISHPLHYDVARVNLVLVDAGVELVDAGDWVDEGAQSMGDASFLNYSRAAIPAGESVSFSLEGRPRIVNTGGAQVPARDATSELLIGGGALLLALVVGAYMFRMRQQAEAYTPSPAPAAPASQPSPRRDQLLHAIAALDDAFEAGEIEQEAYERDRARLKEELLALW